MSIERWNTVQLLIIGSKRRDEGRRGANETNGCGGHTKEMLVKNLLADYGDRWIESIQSRSPTNQSSWNDRTNARWWFGLLSISR